MQNRIQNRISILACMLALMSSMTVYGESPSWHAGGASALSATIPKKNELTSVQEILDHQERFFEKDVTVRGVFRGWKEKCTSSSMITRSDWVLEDDTGCIYITGRIPKALSPLKPKGESVLVQGRVITTKKGKPAIKAAQITLLPK